MGLLIYNVVKDKFTRSRHGVAHTVEGVIDFLAEGTHNSDHNNGNQRYDDRVLNQTLTFLFGGE